MKTLSVCRTMRCGARAYAVMFRLWPVIMLICVSACVETGDFGRRTPSALSGKTHPDLAPDRIASAYSLTDDETELRNRAVRFHKPPRPPAWPALDLIDDWVGSSFDVYYGRLAGVEDQSPTARYRRLAHDIESDTALIAPFRAVGCRVRAADDARLRHVAGMELAEPHASEVRRRMSENAHLIDAVETRMADRLTLYRASLARLRIASPDDEAGAVAALADRLASVIAASGRCI